MHPVPKSGIKKKKEKEDFNGKIRNSTGTGTKNLLLFSRSTLFQL
jgi:hypothetical protein